MTSPNSEPNRRTFLKLAVAFSAALAKEKYLSWLWSKEHLPLDSHLLEQDLADVPSLTQMREMLQEMQLDRGREALDRTDIMQRQLEAGIQRIRKLRNFIGNVNKSGCSW